LKKFDDILVEGEIKGLDSFFGRFPTDHSLCDFITDVVAEECLWPSFQPTAKKIISKIGSKRKFLLNTARARSENNSIYVSADKFSVLSNYRIDLNFAPEYELSYNGIRTNIPLSASQKVEYFQRGRKKEFILYGFNPQILYKHGSLHIFFSMFSGLFPGVVPLYVLTDHLIDRLHRIKGFENLTPHQEKQFILMQLSSQIETVVPFWAGEGNNILIRTNQGAFLGEALKADTPDGLRSIYFLKTFIADFQMREDQHNLEFLDSIEFEIQRYQHFHLDRIYPYQQPTDEEFDKLGERLGNDMIERFGFDRDSLIRCAETGTPPHLNL